MANARSAQSQGSDTTREEYSTSQWQRLSPIAIIYFGVSFIQAIVGQIVYIAPPVILGYNSIKNNPWVGYPLAVAVLALIITSAVLSFYFFQYRLSKNSIEIRSGVLSKKHVNLPFTRIQNVKIERPIYYRFTGFACLTLDTAGSSKQEAKVVALPLEFAEKLKQEILAQRHQVQDTLPDAEPENSTHEGQQFAGVEQVINTRSIKDLVIHGITSNRIWIFLGVLAPFYEKLSDYLGELLKTFGVDLAKVFDPATHSMWQLGLYSLSIAMVIMLLLTLFSIFGSIMTYYGFTLSKVEDRYIRRSGLFTKHEVSMRLSRLQKIAHKRDWLDMLLKRVNLRFEQSSSQITNIENGGVSSLTDKIIVPSVTPEEALGLISDVYPKHGFENVRFNGISKRFFIRYLGYLCTPVYLLVVSFLLWIEKYAVLLPVTVVFAFVAVLVFMRWKRWGYAMDEHFLYIRKGVFGVDHYIFPIYKVQQTIFKQSKLMKRHHLCSVRLVLASGALDIPFIKESQGEELIDRTLYQVETSGKSWM